MPDLLTDKKTDLILDALAGYYGIPMHGKKRKPLASLIATILSQNTSDINSGRAWKSLKNAFPTWQQVLKATDQQVAVAIKAGGLAKQKSTRIRNVLQKIQIDFGELSLQSLVDMDTFTALNYLLSFKGVGKKTAACVLLFSLERNVFPVDTHILRISKRLGWITLRADANLAHEQLAVIIPSERYLEAHVNLISHGRKICRARNPLCNECEINKFCPTGQQNKKPAESAGSE